MKRFNSMKAQKGNVLFLILIAVALFAALSYAVTQSSRSGGDASRETNVINTASLTQYPNSVRTAVLRMIIGAVDPLDIQFNTPDNFSATAFLTTRGVFHPEGGGAAYQQVPQNLGVTGAAIDWIFTADYEIPLLGLSAAGSTGNELIAFAVGVTENICSRVNKELNQYEGDMPYMNVDIPASLERVATNTANTPIQPTANITLVNAGTPNDWFENKAFGCFLDSANATVDAGERYIFYYVMAER